VVEERAIGAVEPYGKFPGWAAAVCMAIFPPIGLFMVGLTTWKVRTMVLFGIGGSILWITGFAQVIPYCDADLPI
jgi:hypothetical protein